MGLGRSIIPTLVEYIKIANQSPAFDRRWREHGHMHRAVELIAGWCRRQPIEGLVVEVIEHPGIMRTPSLPLLQKKLQTTDGALPNSTPCSSGTLS